MNKRPTHFQVYGFSPPPSGTQGAPPASALESAVQFLRRGLRPDGTYEGVDEWEATGHQWRLLREWARGEELILPTGTAPSQAGGFEHDVAYHSTTGKWLKFTKPNRAGYVVEVVGAQPGMFPASPLQYLQRWRLAARIFADDVELVGLAIDGPDQRIVISQRHLKGEAPTWEELHFARTEVYELQESPLRVAWGAYEAKAYCKGRPAVFDVRPANCVRTPEGDVIPFDVIPQIFGFAENAVLRSRA